MKNIFENTNDIAWYTSPPHYCYKTTEIGKKHLFPLLEKSEGFEIKNLTNLFQDDSRAPLIISTLLLNCGCSNPDCKIAARSLIDFAKINSLKSSPYFINRDLLDTVRKSPHFLSLVTSPFRIKELKSLAGFSPEAIYMIQTSDYSTLFIFNQYSLTGTYRNIFFKHTEKMSKILDFKYINNLNFNISHLLKGLHTGSIDSFLDQAENDMDSHISSKSSDIKVETPTVIFEKIEASNQWFKFKDFIFCTLLTILILFSFTLLKIAIDFIILCLKKKKEILIDDN